MKRIAALTSLALVLTGIFMLPANAAGTPVNLITGATSSTAPGVVATQAVGPGNFVSINNTVVSGGSAKSVYFTITGGVTTSGANSGVIAPGASVNVATTAVGTITVLGYAITSGAAATSPTDTITLTVISNLPGVVYASSKVYAAPNTLTPNSSTDSIFSVSQPAGTANVANFSVEEVDANGVTISPVNAKPIAVAVNNGLISSPNFLASPIGNTNYISGSPTGSISNFILSGLPGFGGTATVNISVDGVLLKTYTVKFVGQATRIVLTAINSVVGVGAANLLLPTNLNPIGITANTNALEVQELDSYGNALALNFSNISVKASTPTVATYGFFDATGAHTLGDIPGGTPTSPSVMGVSVDGVSVGTTTFTAVDSALNLTSAPVSIRVSSGVPTMASMSTNLPNYPVGGAGTMSTTVSDAAGPLPAGTYVVFAAQAVASIALSSGSTLLPGVPATVAGPPAQKLGQITLNNQGVYSFAFNAPNSDANVTVSGVPANPSINIAPVTFVVGVGVTGPAVAAPESEIESYNATTSASDVSNLTVGQADNTDNAAQIAVTQTATVQLVLTPEAALVTSVLTKLSTLSAARGKIAAKAKKK